MSSPEYICGALLFPEGLHEGVLVRRSIRCNSPVKVQYFSAKVGFPRCCYYCGKKEQPLEDVDEYIASMKRQYSIVHPLCRACRDSGLDASVRAGITTSAGQRKKQKN